jgi:hypothetical protein
MHAANAHRLPGGGKHLNYRRLNRAAAPTPKTLCSFGWSLVR